MGHIFFKHNCSNYPHIFYKEDINLCFKSKSINKPLMELQELIIIYKKNFYFTQKF